MSEGLFSIMFTRNHVSTTLSLRVPVCRSALIQGVRGRIASDDAASRRAAP
jgi:hypothetical protein